MAQGYVVFVTEINHLLDLKVAALSVMPFLVQPNLDRIFVSRNLIMTESLAFLEGIASIHLVKKSVAVRIHLC